jgi:hypothetical protein
MTLKNIAIVVAVVCATVLAIARIAAADAAAPDTAGGRYVFEKQADGFVRLDTQTGEVALCSAKAVGWACEAVAEDRAVLENEIARLRAENAALKTEIVSHGLPLPAGIIAEPLAQNDEPQNNGPAIHLPSDADIGRMVALVDHAWHRFVEAVERVQKQVFNKS